MVTLFKADLSANFSPSSPVMVDSERLLLELEIDVATAARIELQIEGGAGELGKVPAEWPWFKELGAVAAGATLEQQTLTRVIPSASGTLAAGVHRLLLDAGRFREPMARVQVRVVTGAAKATVSSRYGLAAG